MVFNSNLSLLYSDTLVPDVFITEYLPSLEGDFVKVYIYCVFLGSRNKRASADDIAKKLDMPPERVESAFIRLEELGILKRTATDIVLNDLKEMEIKKLYRPKITSTADEAAQSIERNKKRNKVIASINNAFFQGTMSPSWYTDIDAWFDKYQFDEDVMFALFKHCYDYKGLSRPYITKVAESWHSKNIKNSFDLDKYSLESQKFKDIRSKVMKKLRKQGFLTEYEEAYLERWVNEYGYDFDIIEQALKRTTSAVTPSFEYINSILTDWFKKGYKSKEEIIEAEGAWKSKSGAAGKTRQKVGAAIPQKGNFDQRKYDEDYFENLYKDV